MIAHPTESAARRRVDVVCSDPEHGVNAWLEGWVSRQAPTDDVAVHRRAADLQGGDFLFLVSCTEIVRREVRDRYRHCLVLHGSDLPEGRGWSPVVWQVLEGRSEFTVSLLVAEDEVDSGDVWARHRFAVPPDAVAREINARVFDAELALMTWALENCDRSRPEPQDGVPTYYPRRTPADSTLDAERSLSDQFDLLRVSDPDRYPARVQVRGRWFTLRLSPQDDLPTES